MTAGQMVARRVGLGLALVSLAVATAGCQMTRSEFANLADDAGADFAAAAATLQYAHEGRLPRAFAQATFVNYAAAVAGLDQELGVAAGAPDAATVRRMSELARPAEDALRRPCLDASCDWRGQVSTLRAASEALRVAAGDR